MRQPGEPFVTTRPLVAFIYLLCRDEMPAGLVERMMGDLTRVEIDSSGGYVLSNGGLGEYADEIARRLDDRAVEITTEDEEMPTEADTFDVEA